jgi:hypothetical protein
VHCEDKRQAITKDAVDRAQVRQSWEIAPQLVRGGREAREILQLIDEYDQPLNSELSKKSDGGAKQFSSIPNFVPLRERVTVV